MLSFSFGIYLMSQLIDSPKVFAFIPSYNHAPFVAKSVRSIIGQTFRPKKLLVIDDGSTDDSAHIIEKELKHCPFDAELIVRENRGLSATLNQGLELSEGEYFAYLGSDDLWLREFLAKRVDLLETEPDTVLSFGHAFLIDDNDTVIDCTKDWAAYAEGESLRNLLEGVIPVTSGVVYRRSSLTGFGWNEDSVLEDYELFLKLAAKGRFASGNDVLVCWRKHSYNVSNDFDAMLDEWIAAQDRVADEIKIDRSELSRIQQRLKFLAAAEFVRMGQKRRAAGLFRHNWRGANSLLEIVKLGSRLVLPGGLYKYLRGRRRQHQIADYAQYSRSIKDV